MRGTLLGLFVVAAGLGGGCTLHFGGDDTGDDCGLAVPQGEDALGAPLPSQVNPETLVCETFGSYCDPACGPCPPTEAPPTWAYCGTCNGIDETTCLEATGCRAIYDYACFTGDGPCPALTPYLGCYGTDQTGPIQGACAGLDAFDCSQHDDCIALHSEDCSTGTCVEQFIECRNETTCWGPVLCDGAPPTCPPNSTPTIRNGCYTGDCTPLDECEAPPPPCGDGLDCG